MEMEEVQLIATTHLIVQRLVVQSPVLVGRLHSLEFALQLEVLPSGLLQLAFVGSVAEAVQVCDVHWKNRERESFVVNYSTRMENIGSLMLDSGRVAFEIMFS